MKQLFDVLTERGLVDSITWDKNKSYDVFKNIKNVYAGFDPTAKSLHLGNLVTIIVLRWFQIYGIKVTALVGGATGMIGDPSGKSKERILLTKDAIIENANGIKQNLEAILDFNNDAATMVNNLDWFSSISFIDFLRDFGKGLRMGVMLSKDSVKSRLCSDVGLSYTEFSYQALQAYDFVYLNKNYGVDLQIGGADQWGNITAGIEQAKKTYHKELNGLTFPLLVDSSGKKFGKSENGAIWLSPNMLKPYDFYQELYKTKDVDVIKLLKMLTFVDIEEIKEIEITMHNGTIKPNYAQELLAKELTKIVHGEEGLKKALSVTNVMNPGKLKEMSINEINEIFFDAPSYNIFLNEILEKKLIDLLTKLAITSSKSEARRLINNGGIYLNNKKIESQDFIISEENLIENEILLIGIGKKKKYIIKIKNL